MKTLDLENRIADRTLAKKAQSGLEQQSPENSLPETTSEEPKSITDAIRFKVFGNSAIVRDAHA